MSEKIDLRERLGTILDALKDKVNTITLEFNGEGDSGSIDEVIFDGDESLIPNLTFKPSHKYYGRQQDDIDLKSALEEIGYTYLPGGWEINDGSFGKIIIDVNTRKVKLEFNERISSEEYSEEEYDV